MQRTRYYLRAVILHNAGWCKVLRGGDFVEHCRIYRSERRRLCFPTEGRDIADHFGKLGTIGGQSSSQAATASCRTWAWLLQTAISGGDDAGDGSIPAPVGGRNVFWQRCSNGTGLDIFYSWRVVRSELAITTLATAMRSCVIFLSNLR